MRKAIEATGRKNIILTGRWTKVFVMWPTLSMLDPGYNSCVVEDYCGSTSVDAQDAALSRTVQAGAIRFTNVAAPLEWRRDWAKREHYEALLGLLKQHAGAYGGGN